MPIRRKRIREMATALLEHSRVIEPPIPIERIAKSCGLQIRVEPLNSDLSGFVLRQEGVAVIGVNGSQAPVRQRFTVAHELGHYLLHQEESWHLDRTVFSRFRDDLASQGIDDGEIEANLFAAEVLMPVAMLARDMKVFGAVDTLDDPAVGRLAKRYNVSVQALTLRLAKLGYLDQDFNQ